MTRVLKNGNVLLADGLQQTDVLFDESGILKIGRGLDGDEVIDCTGLTVLPGLVDVHVHLREPGYEHKETIATGSKAAAHGGFTTIFAMPNLNPFPSDAERMKSYLEKIRTDAAVRVIPYGTITDDEKGRKPTDYASLKELGIRWFSDDGVGVGEEKVMEAAMRQAKEAGVMFACHTEDMHYRTPGACVHDSEYGISMGWKGIPSLCESAQFARDLMLAQYIGVKYHGCHISARESVEALAKAKANGADASAEVTAHHLLLEDTDVKGPNCKMNPPLRSHADRMALIAGLESGVLDFIASDHAPHTAADKNKAMADSASASFRWKQALPCCIRNSYTALSAGPYGSWSNG